MGERKPFLLSPAGKDYLWGGTRLNDDFSKGIPLQPLAETWECSTHADGSSTVACGEHEGRALTELLKEHPEYLGTHPLGHSDLEPGELPILIKFIDAKEDLSVQVHPDDAYAREHEDGSLGKTEMWYVLDAREDTKIVYGFRHDMTRKLLEESLKNRTLEKYLQKVNVHADDVFYIEAGTVHAIGAGALIAEIQENSNLTYRMYDYDRVGKDGKKRPLHPGKALDVVNLKAAKEPKQPMRVLRYQPGYASEFLCRCRYFQVERILINTERCRGLVRVKTDSTSFQVLLCVSGCGVLLSGEEDIPFFKGDCIFFPADSVQVRIHGRAQLLRVTC
ncbi:MAG: class I mannose-6-phosphate isomerase [Eubacterium sp.]|nr:class I mannose-6-phosphate isomerase [Eubacterium sp.]MCM1217841.1 class I mannose-6-phosphate isomerase [Lachnospiraceae bacterium]MCM1304659.1 class I mannose-6-phosphate isomerase [Butyrivibrio sp.]MCM1344473.1 class I mannose-6-phosphate isomerase [Muribaculaceae bacterium]MCM1240928.1 class I mannose-6-phosphate isomerase [Lachnospiraceae bacterium]